MSEAGYSVLFVQEPALIPPFMTVAEAADTLRVSPQQVRRMLGDGRLRGERVGRVWLPLAHAVTEMATDSGALVGPAAGADAASLVDDAPDASARAGSLKVLSFFSGAMGLDLGLEAAGLHTVLACEFDRAARATIARNRPELPLLGDIWKYTAADIRAAAGLAEGEEIDVMAGGPPCQAFSTAGSRRGFEDIRGNVFLHFIDLILEMRPRYAVIENVRGLLSAPMKHRPHRERGTGFPPLENDEKRGGALTYVLAMLREGGYDISFNLYNAANYGSAQVRERVVLICSRDGGRVPFLEPTHDSSGVDGRAPWRTVRDSIGHLDDARHDHVEFPPARLAYFLKLSSGENWRNLSDDDQRSALGKSYYSGGGKTGFFRRLAWEKPAPTLVTHPAMPATDLAHPDLPRPLSVQEYKCLQDFPDDWTIEGTIKEQYKQLGNAVPVRLGTAIGHALVRHSSGETWPELDEFPYSRYRATSDRDWATRVG
jgi:DNA (cytosine-5)-methyltransferase 1